MDGTRPTGAPMAAHGCIESPEPNIYVVAVAWQGMVETGAPLSACGNGDYSVESKRRVFSTIVQIATLGT
jgi:hypothetical protein